MSKINITLAGVERPDVSAKNLGVGHAMQGKTTKQVYFKCDKEHLLCMRNMAVYHVSDFSFDNMHVDLGFHLLKSERES